MGCRLGAALLALGALAVPAAARTRWVCEPGRGHGCFARIQDAVDAARPGDTVRVPDGTYRESVVISGWGKRGLRLIGNPAIPAHVLLQGAGKRGTAVLVSGARNVTVRGFTARRYHANGFYAAHAPGFVFRNLVAVHCGDHGLRAEVSGGGSIRDSSATRSRISGVLTDRSTPSVAVRGVSAFLNPIGMFADSAKVTRSLFFNNGVGIVTGVRPSSITGNDIFWNNFDYLLGAPFMAVDQRPPLGTGVLLIAGSPAHVSGNRIFGQFLYGVAAADADAHAPAGLASNTFGFNGLAEDPAEDRNNIDVAYGVPNRAAGEDPEASWLRHEHPEIEGFDPVERWSGN